MENGEDLGASARAFARPTGWTNRPGPWIAFGCVLIAVAVAGMALAVGTRVSMMSLQFMTTLPSLFGIGAFLTAAALRRTPSRVVVDEGGLTLEGASGSERVPWPRIAHVAEKPILFSQRKQLLLLDERGNTAGRIGSDVTGFDELKGIIKAHVSTRQDDAQGAVRRGRLRKNSLFIVGVGILMLVVAVVNARNALKEKADEALFASSAVPATGEVIRQFVAPNGRTLRMEFRVVDSSGGEVTRNVEVDGVTHLLHEAGGKVDILTVPGRPDLARLATGQVMEHDPMKEPGMMLVMSGAIAVMMIAFLAIGIAGLLGYDIDKNEITGKYSIKRLR